MALQAALDVSFIEIVSKRPFDISLSFQEFPYPPHYQNNGATSLFMNMIPAITMFSFVFLCPTILKSVVEEKSNGIKVRNHEHSYNHNVMINMNFIFTGTDENKSHEN